MEFGERTLPRPSFLAVLATIAGMAAARAVGLESAWGPSALVVTACALSMRREARVAALLAGFAGMGCLLQVPQERARTESAAAIAQFDEIAGGLVEVRGRIDGTARVTDRGASVLLAPGSELGKSGEVVRFPGAVYVRLDPERGNLAAVREAVDGDVFDGVGRLLPLPDGPGAGSFESYLASLGAGASFRASLWTVEPARRSPFARYRAAMHGLANGMEEILHENLDRDHAALMSAMMLGRTGWLSPEQRDSFTRAGLMHLFAVSGLHAGIVGIMLALAAAMTGAGPRARAILVMAGLFAFCTLTGFRASAMRASMLVAVFVMQPLLKREVDRLGALSSVALLLLIANPKALWQLGFQLSFLCAATLVQVAPGAVAIEEWAGRRARGWNWRLQPLVRAVQLLYVTTCIQLALAPFLAAHVREVSLAAPVANAVVLPALPLVLGGTILCVGVELVAPGLAEIPFGVLDTALVAVDGVASGLAKLPFASVRARPWSAWTVGGWYVCLLGGAWVRLRPRFTPFDGALSAMGGVLAACLVALGGSAAGPGDAKLTVEFLDAGQGDAILVRSAGATMLVDTGPPEGARLVESLRTRGVERIDALVLTHADADHIGGADRLLEELDVKQVLVGGSLADTETWKAVATEVAWRKTPVSTVRRGARMEFGDGVTVDVLHPTAEFTREGDDRNDASVVLRVAKGEVSFLLTGDAEFDAEESMVFGVDPELLDCTVLKAGHHGSAGSTGAAFLAATSPAHVVFSCGRENRYGHPAAAVVERAKNAGATVRRTDRQGAVMFETDGRGLAVRVERK